MKRKLLPVLVLGLLLLGAAAALADGDIYSGGPWGTKITGLPYTISAPGAYYLGSSLTVAGSDGITINADNVTLDLMGFSLIYGTPGTGIHSAIYMNGRTNVEIRNGAMDSWSFGVFENGTTGSLHRILNIRTRNCDYGVQLKGNGHLIKGCEAVGSPNTCAFWLNGGTGAIAGCRAQDYSSSGIVLDYGGIVRGNVVTFTGTTPSLSGGIRLNDSGASNFLVLGNEVRNCEDGIALLSASSILGNTVTMGSFSSSFGILGNKDTATVLDQNTVVQNASPGSTSFTGWIGGAQTRTNNATPAGRF